MKKIALSLLLTFFSLNSFSQIKFQKGYFINNSGNKIECYIKNVDWKNNPTKFQYKISETEEDKTLTINTVKEFGVYGFSKYKRFDVKIDKSSEILNNLSTNRNPEFVDEQLFLKVLVEGKANLYFYEDGMLKRFFYTKDNLPIEQLVHKSFKVSENYVEKNNHYKQQLLTNLKCPEITLKAINNIDYNKGELEDIFIKYNNCNNSKSSSFGSEKKKEDRFNLSIRPGIVFSSLNTTFHYNENITSKHDLGNGTEIRLGFEAELIFPFNRNKWSFIVEPTYHQFKQEEQKSGLYTFDVNYKSIEMPVGLRHYMYLKDNSKLFFNGLIILDIPIGDSQVSSNKPTDKNTSVGLGMGYKFKNNYSLELRYGFSRNILIVNNYWDADYTNFSVIFGYTIF